MLEDEDESSTSVPDDQPFEWGKDLEKHSFGEFSFAAVKAYDEIEDDGNVETGYGATFAGVYDGHGGHECARYIREHLFNHLTRIIKEHKTISEEVIKNAFAATDNGFLEVVEKEFKTNQRIASTGSCCLVGIIWNKTIYIANAGNSRAVIGYAYQDGIIARQLNREHNVSDKKVREELIANNPDIPDIVKNEYGIWLFKGSLQVSRCLGDAFLKRPEYAFDDGHPIHRPMLSGEPSLCKRPIYPTDRFIIFASDGLWEHMTSRDAARIVHKNPREGIARRLIRIALQRAAEKQETTYERIKQCTKHRWRFHDDITVVVIFIDHDLLKKATPEPQLSIHTFGDVVAASGFNVLETTQASTSDQSSSPSSIISQLQGQVSIIQEQLEEQKKKKEGQKKLMEEQKIKHDQELLKLKEEMARMFELFKFRSDHSSTNTPNYRRESSNRDGDAIA